MMQFYIDDILVIPSWEDVKAEDTDKMVLHIDPGTAFGTGMHETTQLCIRQLRKYITPETELLDVGTGSGLIALMLAQRLQEAEITAIDIDAGAVEQAQYNFSVSPWSDRLDCQQTALQELEGEKVYDLIVSNPPYFQDSLKNPDSQRAMARHTDTLSYDELLKHSARLLKEEGMLALVLPIEAEQPIIALAQTHHLYPTHITHVYPKPGKAAKRLLIALQAYPRPLPEGKGEKRDELTLESETAPRSEAYKELTKEFYL